MASREGDREKKFKHRLSFKLKQQWICLSSLQADAEC